MDLTWYYWAKCVWGLRGVNCYKKRLKEVEEAPVVVVQANLTLMAILLLAHYGVYHAGYQTLINATSWVPDEENTNNVSRRHNHVSMAYSLYGYYGRDKGDLFRYRTQDLG